MLYRLRPPGAFSHITHCSGEDGLASLSGLHRSCSEGFAVTDVFDVVDDRDFCVAGKDKVAVHGVDGEVARNGALGGAEALRDDGTTVDAACAGRMP